MSARFGGSSRLYQRTTAPFAASASCAMVGHYLPGTGAANHIIMCVGVVAGTACVRAHHTGTASTLGYTNRSASDAGASTIASALSNGRFHAIVTSQRSNTDRQLVGRPETAGRFPDGTNTASTSPSGFTGCSIGGRDTTEAAQFVSANSLISNVAFLNRGLTPGEMYRIAAGEWLPDVVENNAIAQWYTLERNFRCVVTGLEMTVEGTVTVDARRPRYLDRKSRRRVGWTPALVSVASSNIFVPLAGGGGLVGRPRGLAA